MRQAAWAVVLLLAGCAEPPSADIDVEPAPEPAPQPIVVGIIEHGNFGYQQCVDQVCAFLNQQSSFARRMGNESVQAMDLTVAWATSDASAQVRIVVECTVGAGRACAGGQVLADGQGPPPFQLNATGLATPPKATLYFSVSAVQTVPTALAEGDFSLTGSLLVMPGADNRTTSR